MSDALEHARATLAGSGAWLVGGAVRDRLLQRATDDLDLVVPGDTADHARRLARVCHGTAFPLSEQHAAWRVIAADRAWSIDLMPLEGTIEEDLARRDFTINAIAEPLDGGPRLDPYEGEADLRARRLRMVARAAFATDALRVLRAARLACQLGLELDEETARAAREHAGGLPGVAPERVFAELRQVVCDDQALRGLELMNAVGATPVVLPELVGLRGVEQSSYHHLDVHDHTLAVLAEVIALQADPEPALGEHAAAVAELLAEPLGDEMTRGDALRLGALLHDAAKPQTRDHTAEGRVTFIGHDEQGAQVARRVLRRLRTSQRLRAHVAALTRHHLRLGFLVHQRPLSRRAVFGYLQACQPVEVDVTVLSIADRLATRGRRAQEAIPAHLDVARELLGEALRWRAHGPPAPLVRGDELAAALGIPPGPQLGRVLTGLAEAQFAGEVATREQAIERARELL